MAYGVVLAGVPESGVEEFRSGRVRALQPSKIVYCSHLLSYWVRVQPLGELLGEAIDGGESLRGDLWHRFRIPMVHPASQSRELYEKLRVEWERVISLKVGPEELGYLGNEIPLVLSVFAHASAHQQAVVSVLDPPQDKNSPEIVLLSK
jgi:hypothetical protein